MNKKIVVIDGQGGRIGGLIVKQLKLIKIPCDIYAVGTNSIATTTMLKAGADFGATGENPAIVNCRDADVIIGPVGIIIADSLLGEITPDLAIAVGQSKAEKVLLPINTRCNNHVIGMQDLSINELIELAIEKVIKMIK